MFTFRRWWLLCGAVLVGVVALNGAVDAKAGPARGSVCVRVGAKATDGVSGRGLVCVQTKVRGLRWRFAPTTTTTTTTSVAPSTTVAVVPTVSLAATFIDSGTFPKAAVVTANVAGTVYLIEGASPVSTVSDITSTRYYRWTSGVVTANTPTSIALDVNVLTNGYYRVFVANSQGVLSAPAFNKVTISIPRISNVAVTTTTVALTCAQGGTCAVGDTGPGGGIVFYVSADPFTSTGSDCNTTCKYLEAAPSDQSTAIVWATTAAFCYPDASDVGASDCEENNIYSNAADQAASRTAATAIGKGMANSNQIHARLTTAGGALTNTYAAGIAYAYAINGKTDWYLPSKDELNQMCKWQRGVAWTSDETVCTGGILNSGRGAGGFSPGYYWSSSENSRIGSWRQAFSDGSQSNGFKDSTFYVRPVRAF
jgi:hypothetical protein